MSSSSHYYYYPTAPVPINPAQKQGYYPTYPGYPGYPTAQPATYSRISASPPEAAESVTTSGVPSYAPSATSSSYAGSASDYDTSTGTTAGVDLLEYMGDRVNGSLDPIPLDRSLAKQAQV
jgi:biogenesis of lysosome-related organelles complex 1 subunit KXD1